MSMQEWFQGLVNTIFLPALQTAVAALVAYLLWRLQKYLEELQKKAAGEVAANIAAEAVLATEQMMSGAEGKDKFELAKSYVSTRVGGSDKDYQRMIEAAVNEMKRADIAAGIGDSPWET